MEKQFDLISLGEAVVEIFRQGFDIPLNEVGDFKGPYPSGAPAITVDTFARLGGRTAFIATIGNDEFGTALLNRFTKDGIDTTQCARLDRLMTGMAITNYFSDGSRSFLYNFTTAATAFLDEKHIRKEFIKHTRWLHISGNVLAFSRKTRKAVIKAAKIAYNEGIPISLDPNIRLEIMDKGKILKLLEPVLKRATMLLPSEGELSLIYNTNKDEEEIINSLLLKGMKIVARKEGKRGCTVFSKDGKTHVDSIQALNEFIVDPTGCGDAFCAGMIFGMLKGWSEKKTAIFANAVGGLAATKRGAMEGADSIEQVISLLRNNNYPDFMES